MFSVPELILQRYKHLQNFEEFILNAVSEEYRGEASEYLSKKREELSQRCREEVHKAVGLYVTEVYSALMLIRAAVVKPYKWLYEMFVEEKVK